MLAKDGRDNGYSRYPIYLSGEDQKAIDFHDESRAPEGNQWWNRVDPLNEMDWHSVVSKVWRESSGTRKVLIANGAGVIDYKKIRVASPIKRSKRLLFSRATMRVVACLNEFGQLTTDQLAALTGIRAVKSICNVLFSAGMLKALQTHSISTSEPFTVWMLMRRSKAFEEWLSQLFPWEYQLIACGVDPTHTSRGQNAPSGIRHNIVMNEIMLKMMEVNNAVIGGWGERHSVAETLSTQTIFPPGISRANVGDGIVVLKSGKIIVFETSGLSIKDTPKYGVVHNYQSNLAEKAGAWAAVAGKSDYDINVIFVDIAVNPDVRRFAGHMNSGAYYVAEKYAPNNETRARGQARLFMADAYSWFPLARTVSQDFKNLTCINAMTHKKTNLIEPGDEILNKDNPIVTNTALAMHTPMWSVQNSSMISLNEENKEK